MRGWILCVLLLLAGWLAFARGTSTVGVVRAGDRSVPEPSDASPTLTGATRAEVPLPPDVEQEEGDEDAEEEDEHPEPPPKPVPPMERPDPIELGPCTLELSVVDDSPEAEPVRGNLRLWRLHAPGNADWSEGHQLQAEAYTNDEGRVTFEELPCGTYRAEALARRAFGDDPPAFDVSAEAERHTLVVALPKKRRAYVRILDERGEDVRAAWCWFSGCSNTRSKRTQPLWHVPRRTPEGEAGRVRPWAWGSVSGCGRAVEVWRVAGERGFDFHFTEADRSDGSTSNYGMRAPDGGTVSFSLDTTDEAPEGNRDYIVRLVPDAQLLAGVLLPDGRPALQAGADVSTSFRPALVGSEGAEAAWRRAPIEVRVTLPGFHALCFETDLDGPPPRWTLVPPAPGEQALPLWEVPIRKERRGEPASG